MSDSQIKPIKINPELLSMSPRNVKKRTLKKSTTDNIKPNKLKQNLLAKIKNYRQNKRGSNDISNTNNVNGPVGGSMDSAAGNNVSIVVKNKPTIPTSPNTKNNLSWSLWIVKINNKHASYEMNACTKRMWPINFFIDSLVNNSYTFVYRRTYYAKKGR